MSKQQMWLKDEEEKVSTMLFFMKEDVEKKSAHIHGHPLFLCNIEKPQAEVILALQSKCFTLGAEDNVSRACYFAQKFELLCYIKSNSD